MICTIKKPCNKYFYKFFQILNIQIPMSICMRVFFANIDILKERSHLFLQKYACQIFKIRLDLNLDDVIKERVHN